MVRLKSKSFGAALKKKEEAARLAILAMGRSGVPASGVSAAESGTPPVGKPARKRQSANDNPDSGAVPYTRGRPRKGQDTGFDSKHTFYTSIQMEAEQYNTIRALAAREGKTIKVMMYELLKTGLKHHK